ncbi:MucBP domain-containing protein [Leuconostoc gelidum subsp. gelidum]|uniref:MucBP domain-containing protein n=1 Tax=Leuconostoc gelidum TaxID=1244 RepID=UPI001CC51754|nr:MucBP domain-containing protein [Leuconostoc gelidum]MBZ6013419.1 MucBP domain-containing protein [Leuconostoc gelidum subsp. gelidum]
MTNQSPIWIYYENIATHEQLLPPERLDGLSKTTYTIDTPTIPNYVYVDNSGELSGIFGNFPQSLHLNYRPQSWRDAHRVNMYIALHVETLAHTDPDDYANISTRLPPDSYWATPLRVISGNGQFWYQVGDHVWIRYDASLMSLSDTAPNVENINYIQDLNVENDQPNALVNFLPNMSTEIFATPYGLPIGSVLDGDLVAISKEERHENGLLWYKLANSGWINSIYVHKI